MGNDIEVNWVDKIKEKTQKLHQLELLKNIKMKMPEKSKFYLHFNQDDIGIFGAPTKNRHENTFIEQLYVFLKTKKISSKQNTLLCTFFANESYDSDC
eukprot:23199_1